MDSESVFYFLLSIVLVLAAYVYVFPQFPDVAPVLLLNQSSIAPIRKPGQTAIYRSTVTGHGSNLVKGLSIAESKAKTRDGNFGDLWKLVENCTIGTTEGGGNGVYTVKKLTHQQITKLVHVVGTSLAKWTGIGGKSVAIVLPSSFEAFVVMLSGVLFNVPVVLVPYNVDSHQAHEVLKLANAGVVVSTKEKLDELEGLSEDFEAVYLSTTGQFGSGPTFSDLHRQSEQLEKADIPEYGGDESKYPVRLAYVGFDKRMAITGFTDGNVVSAIAAQIHASPRADLWKPSDSVLCCESSFSMYGLVLSFVAIVQGSSLVLPNSAHPTTVNPELIQSVKPTVVVTDDQGSAGIVDMAKKLTMFQSLRTQMGLASLSRGQLPSAVLSQFKSVRLMYSSHSTVEFKGVTAEQTNQIRALTGSKFIHALTSPLSASAVTQTHPSDYRTPPESYVNYGVALPCVELVLMDHGSYMSEDKKGQVHVRGYSLPSGTQWVNIGIIGAWGEDGTLRLYH